MRVEGAWTPRRLVAAAAIDLPPAVQASRARRRTWDGEAQMGMGIWGSVYIVATLSSNPRSHSEWAILFFVSCWAECLVYCPLGPDSPLQSPASFIFLPRLMSPLFNYIPSVSQKKKIFHLFHQIQLDFSVCVTAVAWSAIFIISTFWIFFLYFEVKL